MRWLTLADGALVTSIAVDRPVYVAFTAPVGHGQRPAPGGVGRGAHDPAGAPPVAVR